MIKRYWAGYAAIVAALLVLDGLWLGLIAMKTYQSGIGHLMASSPNLVAGGVFYLLYPLGLVIFVLAPNASDPGWRRTVVMGALFGFFAYGTYDVSNLATLRDWPVSLTLLDVAWGTALSAACAAAGQRAMTWVDARRA